ncbi:MAG TPA: hypothetical protein VGK19_04910 [Capsulimonadaceae bacterium]|jgi:hypothetical protein
MKVRVKLTIEDRNIDEVMEAPDAATLLAKAKDRVAKELGWKGFFLKALTPVQFAQEAVKRFNEATGNNHPLPASAEEFLEFGKSTGYLTVLEP